MYNPFWCPYPCDDYQPDWDNHDDKDHAPPCIHTEFDDDERKIGCGLVTIAQYQWERERAERQKENNQ
jgi:hypothetical protein